MSVVKEKIKSVIFGTTTPAGKAFDIILIVSILLSVALVMFDSIEAYNAKYGRTFYFLEWVVTIFFTIEYFLRIYCVRRPSSYIFSFFGIIDLLALIPTYLSVLFPGAEIFSVIRVLRVLRIFRVLKLVQFMGEAEMLRKAMEQTKTTLKL